MHTGFGHQLRMLFEFERHQSLTSLTLTPLLSRSLVRAPSPCLTYLMHMVCDESASVPAGHGRQARCPLRSWKRPELHCVHLCEPRSWYFPGWHGACEHAVLAGVDLLPSGHRWHDLLPAAGW